MGKITKAYRASGAIGHRRLVKFTANDDEVALATSPADVIAGVSDCPGGAPNKGRVDIVLEGIAQVEAGGPITPGAAFTADANGRAVADTASGKHYVGGRSIYNMAAGDWGDVIVSPALGQGGGVIVPFDPPIGFLMESFDSLSGYTTLNGSLQAIDSVNKVQGDGSLKVTGPGGSQTVSSTAKPAIFASKAPADLGTVALLVRLNDLDVQSIQPQIGYNVGAGGNYYGPAAFSIGTVEAGWRWLAFNAAEIPELQAVTPGTIGFRPIINMRNGVNQAVVNLDALVIDAKGTPTFKLGFDDMHDTIYTVALPMMNALGLKGTLYFTLNQLGQAGKLTEAQVVELYQVHGWDIAINGTVDDTSMTSKGTVSAVIAGLDAARNWLSARGLTRAMNHFNYPSGSAWDNANGPSGEFYIGKIQAAAKAAGYKTGRLASGTSIFTRFGLADQAFYMPCAAMSGQTFAQLQATIDQAVLRGVTQEFYIHRLEDTPAASNTAITIFQQVINYLSSLRTQRLAAVLTKSQFYARDAGASVLSAAPVPSALPLHKFGMNVNTRQEFEAAEAWLGTPMESTNVFFELAAGTRPWSECVAKALAYGSNDANNKWSLDRGLIHDYCIGLATASEPLSETIAGLHDDKFLTIAQRIAAVDKNPFKPVRLGHEPDFQTAYPMWTFNKPGGAPPYIAAYRRAAPIIKGVDPSFKTMWCVSAGTTPWDPSWTVFDGFPGYDYVDGISVDIYHFEQNAGPLGSKLFYEKLVNPEGLLKLYELAENGGLFFAISEMGSNHNSGEFVENLKAFLKGKKVTHVNLFNKDNSNNGINYNSIVVDEHLPLYSAATKRAYGPILWTTPTTFSVSAGSTVDLLLETNRDDASYSIVGGADAARFTVAGGKISALAGLPAGSYTVTVRATDERGIFADRTITIPASGVQLLPETQIALSRMTVAPAAGLQTALNTLLGTLKSIGALPYIDALYAPMQDTEQASLINLRKSRYNLTKSGGALFERQLGIRGDGIGGVFDSGFVPSVYGNKFRDTSFYVGMYSLTGFLNGAAQSDDLASDQGLVINYTSSNGLNGRPGMATTRDFLAAGSFPYPGYLSVMRTARDAWSAARNGVIANTGADIANGQQHASLRIGGSSQVTTFGVNKIGLVIVGGSELAAMDQQISAAVNTYINAVRGYYPITDLGTKLKLWYNAHRIDQLTMSGGLISNYKDQKSYFGAAQATTGYQPAYSAAGFGGVPALQFDGADDFLSAPNSLGSGAVNLEIWAVLQNTEVADVSNDRPFFKLGGGTFGTQVRCSKRAADGTLQARVGTGGSGTVTALAGKNSGTDRTVFGAIVTPTTLTVEADGVAGAPQSAVPAITSGGFDIGALSPNPTVGWKGLIRDLIVTDGLTTGERDNLRTYLMARRNL